MVGESIEAECLPWVRSSHPGDARVRLLSVEERKFSVRMSGAGRKADVVRDAPSGRLLVLP